MDSKKKKSKKKKGSKPPSNDVQTSVGEVALHIGSAPLLNQVPRVPSSSDVQSVEVSESDAELDRHRIYEEKFLQEEVGQLQDEKSKWMQKEASLEEQIKLLQNNVDSCIRKQVGLEEKLKDLLSRNDIFIQKESTLEERVKHIEGLKDSWILKETQVNDFASKLDEVNLRLQDQVKELKESRYGFIQENTQLRERIAVMESQLQRIETEVLLFRSSPVNSESPVRKISQYQSEATPPPLVDKRESEESELVEKVKEVQIESDNIDLDQHVMAINHSNSPNVDHVKEPAESAVSVDHMPECSQDMYESGELVPPLVRAHNPFVIPNGVEDFNSLNGVRQGQLLGLDNPRISEDIVSVPLDDLQGGESQTIKEEELPLPLSDAPLIGAPFRLISFFTKYVSGADLVHQNRERSG